MTGRTGMWLVTSLGFALVALALFVRGGSSDRVLVLGAVAAASAAMAWLEATASD